MTKLLESLDPNGFRLDDAFESYRIASFFSRPFGSVLPDEDEDEAADENKDCALKRYFDELNDLLPLKRRIRAVKPREKWKLISSLVEKNTLFNEKSKFLKSN